MDKTTRTLAIGLLILIIFTPLGLLATGDTFGEWSNKEIKEKLGFVPGGMEKLAPVWNAPLPDYALPGDKQPHSAEVAYVLSAIIGVAICISVIYFIGKKIAKD